MMQDLNKPRYATGKRRSKADYVDRGVIVRNGLNEYYLKAVKGMPRLRDSLTEIMSAIEKDGTTEFQSLDREILMATTLLRETYEQMAESESQQLPAATASKVAKSFRIEIASQLELLRKLKETNNEFYHGSKYSVRLDEAAIFVQTVMQILLSEIKDVTLLRRIASRIDDLCGSGMRKEVPRREKAVEIVATVKENEFGKKKENDNE